MAARFPVGGIRTFLRHVYAQPVFDECEITLLAPTDELGELVSRYVPAERMSVQDARGAPREFLGKIRATLKAGRFDLLHSHGLTTGVLGEVARTGTGTPHLTTVHDVFLPTTFKGFRGRAQQAGLNLVMRRCDAIHAVSVDCARNFCEYLPFVKQERVYGIVNGIDTDAILKAVPVDAHAELGLPSQTKLIGFFGRFMGQKGFRVLVDAVEILIQNTSIPAFRVVTFGWGGFIREDYQYLKDKGLGEYFIQQPRTDEPYQWMKAMDVVAMPSRWEACGLVAMEVLTAGTALVATNCIGLREILEDTPALISGVMDPSSLAHGIMRVLCDDIDDSFKMYQSEAAKRYSVISQASELFTLYQATCR
jgi:glycosyltransferase involved in cell wall biosynthesis